MFIEDFFSKLKTSKIVPFDLNASNLVIFDLTDKNEELQKEKSFSKYIKKKLQESGSSVGVGRYDEDRIIYKKSTLFNNQNSQRTIHLGIDIWAEEGTPIFAPTDARIHSFKDNIGIGDYGPTIILEHKINDKIFYTLYGHLGLKSIKSLKINQGFTAGDKIAEIGEYSINGNWPPHLHFQIITDMQGKKGDFPGVCTKSERKKYLKICPNPNLILNISKLKKRP